MAVTRNRKYSPVLLFILGEILQFVFKMFILFNVGGIFLEKTQIPVEFFTEIHLIVFFATTSPFFLTENVFCIGQNFPLHLFEWFFSVKVFLYGAV